MFPTVSTCPQSPGVIIADVNPNANSTFMHAVTSTATQVACSSHEISINPTHATGIKCSQSSQGHLITICVLYIRVYIIDKIWREYEPNQTAYYVVNLGLIMSKPFVNYSCFNIVAHMEQQQIIRPIDNSYCQFQQPVFQFQFQSALYIYDNGWGGWQQESILGFKIVQIHVNADPAA